jgi:hypothetical protein
VVFQPGFQASLHNAAVFRSGGQTQLRRDAVCRWPFRTDRSAFQCVRGAGRRRRSCRSAANPVRCDSRDSASSRRSTGDLCNAAEEASISSRINSRNFAMSFPRFRASFTSRRNCAPLTGFRTGSDSQVLEQRLSGGQTFSLALFGGTQGLDGGRIRDSHVERKGLLRGHADQQHAHGV